MKIPYDPSSSKLLSFYDKIPGFINGTDTPRAYLERCIETIETREHEVKAFVTLSLDRAREAADASALRYKENRILSPLDGMPLGMKDVFETEVKRTVAKTKLINFFKLLNILFSSVN